MNISKTTCINGLEISTDVQGKHHEALHNKIFELEKENKALKEEIQTLRATKQKV